MGKLKALGHRIKTLDTNRVKPLPATNRTLIGRARVNMKREVYKRDGGRCCLCNKVVDLFGSELDHKIALQFGGMNDAVNLWTLCKPCHDMKSIYEVRNGHPLPAAAEAPEPAPLRSEPDYMPIA